MTENKSCLNCLYGKTEKQPEGYYCCTRKYSIHIREKTPCNFYKPRPSQCETDECKWFGEHKGKDFCYFDDDFSVGETCDYFEKEAEVQIEFQGKKYERTDKSMTMAALIIEAGDGDCPQQSIRRFAAKFYDRTFVANPYKEIPMMYFVVTWLTTDSDLHIPWLVEKEYLRECVEEVKQLPNQWYRGNIDGNLIYSDVDFRLICMTNKRGWAMGKRVSWDVFNHILSPVPPPTITEQPEPAERRPEKCVHNRLPRPGKDRRWCNNSAAVKELLGGEDWIYCDADHWKSCSHYSEE